MQRVPSTSVPLLLAACWALSASAAHAQDAFYTAGTYTIDAAHSVNGNARVGEDSGGHFSDPVTHNPYNPTVNLVTGGSVVNVLYAYNSSTVNMSGGSVGSLQGQNSSTFNVSGGQSDGLAANDSSTFNVSGGSDGSGLIANDSSMVTISGGTFGQFFGVNFRDATTGSFTLIGNNLMATNPRPDTIFFGGTDYDLSGTLQNGTDLSGYVLNVQNGSIFTLQNAAAVPEPGALALFAGVGVTSLLAVARQKRRR